MKSMPYVIFFVCAAIAGYAAVGLFSPQDYAAPILTPYRLHRDVLGCLLVFFGLASVTLPVITALNNNDKGRS